MKVLLLKYFFFNLRTNLPRAEVLGGRFAKDRFRKGPNCLAPGY